MTDSNRKYLVIDLEKCDRCDACHVDCDCYHRPHTQDHGITALREQATFMLICRRCQHASCVAACPFDAIERNDDGTIERHNLRCVSCMSCAHACPFGTIYTDMLPFYQTLCDACLANHSLDGHPQAPSCVAACSKGALEFREVDATEVDVHVLGTHLAARAHKWVRHEELR